MKSNMKKDFLTLMDYSKEEILAILNMAREIKTDPGSYSNILKGKNIALLFDKPSTRTRVSFEVGINQLGGNCLVLDSKNLQLGRGETYADTAKIFDAYLDGVVIRTFKQETIVTMAKNCSIPVINALTDSYHPCQILADLQTLIEKNLLFRKNFKFIYFGDPNNVSNSLLIGFTKLGIDITICSPESFKTDNCLMDYLKTESAISGNTIYIENDPIKAVYEADVIYTDVWVSMGQDEEKEKIEKMMPYQINSKLLKLAKKDVKVMHCLPAHREMEITSEILDSDHSIVWEQAGNRLHAQKGLLKFLYDR
ncbi:MAG TPA: ornithine carbamoyltransferase [Actinobacteria bacterium]|nr:ornithine carbamoyltransferase [Actinomycetota bacterium]